jgi:hypothetical protein
MRQLIKRQTTERVVMVGDFIPLRQKREKDVTLAEYNYKNANAVPSAGQITSGGLQIRINEFDANHIFHGEGLDRVTIGNTITIGTQSAVITTAPIETSGYFFFDVDAWPLLADGKYNVSITP